MSNAPRPRTRAAGAGPARQSNQPPAQQTGGWGYRGAAIHEQAAKAQADAERRRSGTGAPLRFYCKKDKTIPLVILDHSVEEGMAFFEHNFKDSEGFWSIHEPCIKDFAVCPACKHGNSSYVLMLSVLVLDPFTTQAGKEVPWSKMLLPIKTSQFNLFRQLEAAAMQESGTMRGMYLVMARNSADTQSPRIGEPQMQDGGRLFTQYSEDDLVQDFGHEAVLGQDGRSVLRPQDWDITPYDYTAIFHKPDVADLNRRYGQGAHTAGSVDEAARAFEEDQAAPTPPPAQAAPPAPRTRTAAAPPASRAPAPPVRGRTTPPAPAAEPSQEETQAPAPAACRRAVATPTPATRVASRRAAPAREPFAND